MSLPETPVPQRWPHENGLSCLLSLVPWENITCLLPYLPALWDFISGHRLQLTLNFKISCPTKSVSIKFKSLQAIMSTGELIFQGISNKYWASLTQSIFLIHAYTFTTYKISFYNVAILWVHWINKPIENYFIRQNVLFNGNEKNYFSNVMIHVCFCVWGFS